MRVLTEEIAKLSPPVRAEEIAAALRKDLSEIAEALKNAVPPGALASLESQVRELGARVEGNRATLQDHPVIGEIERSLADLRQRLEVMAPIGDVASLAETVRTLSTRADAIANQVAAPERLQQLDEAIATLRELVGHIASPADIAALSRDIQALAEKVDNSARPDEHSTAAMMTLDRRLAEMAAAFDNRHAEAVAIPSDLEALFARLANRLDSVEALCGDPGALHALDGRIAGLVDKLDASEARFGRLDTVERGVADLVEQIQALRTQNDDKLQAIQRELIDNTTRAVSEPAEAIRRDVATLKELQSAIDRRTQDTFEAVYGTIEQVVDRLASIEEDRRPKDNPGHDAGAHNPGHDPGNPRPNNPGPQIPGPIPPQIPLPHTPAPQNSGPQNIAPDIPGPKASAEKPMPVLVADAPALAPAATPLRERLVLAMEDAKPGVSVRPLVSDLPPDAPLEPGSGARRIRAMAGALDRIAGADAAPAPAPAVPSEPDTAVRANFVAAARRAARAVAGEQNGAPATRFTVTGEEKGKRTGAFVMRFGPQIKAVIVGISVVAIVLGALRLAMDLFTGAGANAPTTEMQAPDTAPIAPPVMPPNPPTPGKGAGIGGATRGAAAVPAETPRAAVPAAIAPAVSPARDAAPKAQEVRDTAPQVPAPLPAKEAGEGFDQGAAAARDRQQGPHRRGHLRRSGGELRGRGAPRRRHRRAAGPRHRGGLVRARRPRRRCDGAIPPRQHVREGPRPEEGPAGGAPPLCRRRRQGQRQGDAQPRRALRRGHRRQAGLSDGDPVVPQGRDLRRRRQRVQSRHPLCPRRRHRAQPRRVLQVVRARGPGRRQGCRQEGPRHRRPSRRAAIERRASGRRKLRSAEPARRCGVREGAGRRLGP